MTLSHVQKVRKLYKAILKLHRGLPSELQVLGTNYVKEEFKRHKNCASHEAETFMKEWTGYTVTLAKQLIIMKPEKMKQLGKRLSESDLDKLRDEQIVQLYELMTTATGDSDQELKKT